LSIIFVFLQKWQKNVHCFDSKTETRINTDAAESNFHLKHSSDIQCSKHDRQCMYNLTMMRIHSITVAVEKQ